MQLRFFRISFTLHVLLLHFHLDVEWAQCLGFVMIDRSLVRIGMQRMEQCQNCIERYCWDETSFDDEIIGPKGGRYKATEHA
jgi:hypothetical protein